MQCMVGGVIQSSNLTVPVHSIPLSSLLCAICYVLQPSHAHGPLHFHTVRAHSMSRQSADNRYMLIIHFTLAPVPVPAGTSKEPS